MEFVLNVCADIAYDFYGTRLATCSSDQRIKIFDQDPTSGSWTLNDSFKSHDASVLKLSWANPGIHAFFLLIRAEFGNVLASCSLDRTIRVWEEQELETRGSGKRWVERAKLSDSRTSILDASFSPPHLGLKLATVGADGVVRVYEAIDVLNLTQWSLLDEFSATNTDSGSSDTGESLYCLAWCPSRFTGLPMLAIGCGRENCVKVGILL